MSGANIYVTRAIPEEAKSLLRGVAQISIWDNEDAVPREELLKGVVGVQGIFCTISDVIDKEVLDSAGSDLRIVATMSVGKDHIDLIECSRRGVYVANTSDIAADSAADLAVALVLMATRRVIEGVDAVRKGQWEGWKPTWLCGTSLMNKTLGILGFGRVGFGIARRLKPFGIHKVIYNDIQEVEYALDFAEFVSFDELLAHSDILCICCSLTSLTRNMFTKSEFKKMKNSAVLINTSRGPIVNHVDLTEALKEGDIASAGLDVTDPEPLPVDHPLTSLPNCVILPHMGTSTIEARKHMAMNTAKNIVAMVSTNQS
ncbi:hypothetical protein FSP39_015307 [Pinctada imbricata]|uniref:Glyoxylate reductase/hydroxypyruvate reductase n=1 Tax=Pinctada imbricata TaxID=66713 RepID=A0AA88YPT2_PINIB|nr:hypothetical protein FSP39_015307 [Pinctada imbricata]